jgi:signal transduction histidine kinase
MVCVSDSGPGIPDQTERIFEKFTQIQSIGPSHGRKGTGLGLTFCKLAIEAHGETIWVEPSKSLPGACFAFTLPVFVDLVPDTR